MKNYLGILIIIILLFFIYREYKPQNESSASLITDTAVATTQSEISDYSAGFAVFIHNSFQNFSEDIYIQSEHPNTISINKAGRTWGDFFKTLPMTITKNCLTKGKGQNYCTGQGGKLQFYVNGVKTDEIEKKPIQQGDKLLITYGFETDEQILLQQKQLNDSVQP
jgi:hypothetical protein